MIFLLLAVLAAPQQDATAFAKRIVAAMNSGSVETRRALQHPSDLPCGARGDSMIAWQLNRQAKGGVPANAEITITKPGKGSLQAPGLMVYSVQPTHEAEIKWSPKPDSYRSIFVWMVRDKTGWHEVLGCPSQTFLERIRK